MQTSERRPLVATAMGSARGAFFGVAAVSGITSLLMLIGPLFMLEIFDRVLASRSVPTGTRSRTSATSLPPARAVQTHIASPSHN